MISACASSTRSNDSGIASAIEQPFRDLNLVQDEPRAVVRQAAVGPYRPPSGCGEARAEIGRLNAALGADLDQADGAEGLVGDLLKEVLAIPLRGVVRRITGATAAEREHREAIIGAVARRGFLNGWVRAGGCEAGAAASPAPVVE